MKIFSYLFDSISLLSEKICPVVNYVINFEDFPLQRENLGKAWSNANDREWAEWLRAGIVPLDYEGPVTADWPDLLSVLEQRVKFERTRKKPNGSFVLRDPLPQRWWQYADKRPALYATLCQRQKALVTSQTSKYLSLALVSSKQVFSHKLVVFPHESMSWFCTLQSRPHQNWADFFGSSLEDRPVYTPSDCFETFPFPENFETNKQLETIGKAYYDFRAQLMVANNEGLTKTYNRFHDPNEHSPEILKLRELHDAMDRAVLDAYGWTDLVPTCEFLLDYEEDEDEDDGSSRRKKPWRYRWPDDFRDEVLARLLDLNAQRAEQERLAGLTAEAARGKSKGRKKKTGGIRAQRKKETQSTIQQTLLDV